MDHPVSRGHADYPRGLLTRKLCIAGLCASALLAIGCFAAGGTLFKRAQLETGGWMKLTMPRAMKEILPLLINVLITILTESNGLIHATTLRWALGEKLTFASNLRLFTRVKGRFPFGIISNFLNAGFLALSYCATSLILSGDPPHIVCGNAHLLGNGSCPTISIVYFAPGALLALGTGLAGGTALTTWQLYSPLWSRPGLRAQSILHGLPFR